VPPCALDFGEKASSSMPPNELKLISDFYDFMLWLTHHTEKFPRHHRYGLGCAIEARLREILKLLLAAKYSPDKQPLLREANMELDVLRFEVRLAKDLRVLSFKSHGHAAELMHSIGSQIGGWLKNKKGNG